MNKIALQITGLFFLLLPFQQIAKAQDSACVTKLELDKSQREQSSDLSPGPADIIGTGLMVIGSSLLIPYTCIPDGNNPEMTRNKIAACSGSVIYVLGQTTDFFVKLANMIRHL